MTATTRACVYADYDITAPPPHPGDGWTRFVCISDTHSKRFPVPDGDVLLHSGDLSSHGHPGQLKVTIDWLHSLPHPAKVYVAFRHAILCVLRASLVSLPGTTMCVRKHDISGQLLTS
jgi:hypothetical protein